MNCFLPDPVVSCSYRSWQNIASALRCLCVQRRTDEGRLKGRSLYNQYFRYASCDYAPYRILYSKNPVDYVAVIQRHHSLDDGSARHVLAVSDDFGEIMEAYSLIVNAWKVIFMRKSIPAHSTSFFSEKSFGFPGASENENDEGEEAMAVAKKRKEGEDAMRVYLPPSLQGGMRSHASTGESGMDASPFLPFSPHRWEMLLSYIERGGKPKEAAPPLHKQKKRPASLSRSTSSSSSSLSPCSTSAPGLPSQKRRSHTRVPPTSQGTPSREATPLASLHATGMASGSSTFSPSSPPTRSPTRAATPRKPTTTTSPLQERARHETPSVGQPLPPRASSDGTREVPQSSVSSSASSFSSRGTGKVKSSGWALTWKRTARTARHGTRHVSSMVQDVYATLTTIQRPSLAGLKEALSIQSTHPVDRGLSMTAGILFIGTALLLSFMWYERQKEATMEVLVGQRSDGLEKRHVIADYRRAEERRNEQGKGRGWEKESEALSRSGLPVSSCLPSWTVLFDEVLVDECPAVFHASPYTRLPSSPSSLWRPVSVVSSVLMFLSGLVLFFYLKGAHPERQLSRGMAAALSLSLPSRGWRRKTRSARQGRRYASPTSPPSPDASSGEANFFGRWRCKWRGKASLGQGDGDTATSSVGRAFSSLQHHPSWNAKKRRICRLHLAPPSLTAKEEQLLTQLQNYGAPYSSIVLRPLRGWNAPPGTAGWSETWRFKDLYFSERHSPFSSSSLEVRAAISIPHTSMGTLQSILLQPFYPEVSPRKRRRRATRAQGTTSTGSSPSFSPMEGGSAATASGLPLTFLSRTHGNDTTTTTDSTRSGHHRCEHEDANVMRFPNFLYPLCTEMEIIKKLEHNIFITRTVEHSRVFGVPPTELYTYVSPAVLLDAEQQRELHLRHPFSIPKSFPSSSSVLGCPSGGRKKQEAKPKDAPEHSFSSVSNAPASSHSSSAGYVYLSCAVHCPMEDLRRHLSYSHAGSSGPACLASSASSVWSSQVSQGASSSEDVSCTTTPPLQHGKLHHQVWMGFEEPDESLTLVVYRSLSLPCLDAPAAAVYRKTAYRTILHTMCRLVRVLQQLGPMPNELRGYRNHPLYLPFWTTSRSSSDSDSSASSTPGRGLSLISSPPIMGTASALASHPLQPPPGIHWSSSLSIHTEAPLALEPLGGIAGSPALVSSSSSRMRQGGEWESSLSLAADFHSFPLSTLRVSPSCGALETLDGAGSGGGDGRHASLASPMRTTSFLSGSFLPLSAGGSTSSALPSPLLRFLNRISMKNTDDRAWKLLCNEQEKGLKIFRGDFETTSGQWSSSASPFSPRHTRSASNVGKKLKQLKTEVYFPFQSLDAIELEIMTDFMFPSFGFEVSRRQPLGVVEHPIPPDKVGLVPVETVFKVRGAERVLSPRSVTMELLEGLHFTVRQLQEAVPETLWNDLSFLHHLPPNTCMFFYGGEGVEADQAHTPPQLQYLSPLERPLCIEVPSYGFLCWKSSYITDETVSHLGTPSISPNHSVTTDSRSIPVSRRGESEPAWHSNADAGDEEDRITASLPSPNERRMPLATPSFSPSTGRGTSVSHPAPLPGLSTPESTAGGVRMIAMVEYGSIRPFHWTSEWNYQAKQIMQIKKMVEVITDGCVEYFSHTN